jgi:16S rRNA (guanine527-N7)-methyltransferase
MTEALVREAQERFGVTLTPEQAAHFDTYARLLAEWNVHTNLTAITAPNEVEIRHFLDSLSIVKAADLKAGTRIIDVGSGAGFPGLPLAIVFPQIKGTLLEATGKKVAFLEHLIDEFSLINVQAVHARAEEAGQMPAHRAKYDLVLARAVARLPSLLEYLLPLAKVGGYCIAMKGRTAHEEAADSARTLQTLGGRLRDIIAVDLPEVSEAHYLVVVEKMSVTPAAYPRKPGVPTHKPLV